MSATLNADLFVNYFRDGSLGGSIGGVSLVSIPGILIENCVDAGSQYI